ncbi:MAG: FAD-dependent oxidoreductase [Anaerolineales bacterium]
MSPDTRQPSPEAVVIGAGLAGLAAAAHLAERGVPVLLLEADSLYPGGRLWGGRPLPLPPSPPPAPIRSRGRGGSAGAGEWGEAACAPLSGATVTLNGLTRTFYPEHGVHGLWNEYHNLRATLERLGIAPEVILAEEEEWIHGEGGRIRRVEIGSAIRDAFLPAPLHYLELFTRPGFLAMLGPREWLSLPGVWYSLLLAVALDPFGRGISLEGQTLTQFFRGWSPRVAALFTGLARNSLAARTAETPLASFIAFLRFYTLLRRDAWRFSYLTTDPGTALIQPLVERICARQGRLLLGAAVDGLTPYPCPLPPLPTGEGRGVAPQEPGWRVRFHTRLGLRTFFASHVILAVDAPAARRLLCESQATRPEAEKLTWPNGQPSAVVRAWLDVRPRPGPEAGIFTGDFVADNFFWLHYLQRDFVEWAQATGGSAVEMHIYGPADFLAQPDAVVLARAITDLYRAFPELRGHLRAHSLQRNAPTHSRLVVDRPERWLGVRTPWPNLWACGDWVRGPWPCLFLERACVSGIEAANAVLESLDLEPFPVLDYSEPEWLAGKIQHWLLGGRGWLRRVLKRA